jgi:hypothetical protein
LEEEWNHRFTQIDADILRLFLAIFAAFCSNGVLLQKIAKEAKKTDNPEWNAKGAIWFEIADLGSGDERQHTEYRKEHAIR